MTMTTRINPVADIDLGGSGESGDCQALMTTRPVRQKIIPCDNGYKIEDIDFIGVDIKLDAPRLDLNLETLLYQGANVGISLDHFRMDLTQSGEIKENDRLTLNDLIIEKRGGELHVFSEKLKVVFHGEHI